LGAIIDGDLDTRRCR